MPSGVQVRLLPWTPMFNLSYQKTLNKRRFLTRGKKKRYSVYRAEENLVKESISERCCRRICEAKGIDLSSVMIEDSNFPWKETLEYLYIIHGTWPYSNRGINSRFRSEEVKEILRKNIEIAKGLK